VLGPRFDVLLTSYETVLKDKTELKKLNYAVRRSSSGSGGNFSKCRPTIIHSRLAVCSDWLFGYAGLAPVFVVWLCSGHHLAPRLLR
jgi:putative component of toxin-antitoxin plasmid stabilization module